MASKAVIVALITQVISYRTLTVGKWRKTSWDFEGGYNVDHKKLSPLGVAMAVIIVIVVGILITP